MELPGLDQCIPNQTGWPSTHSRGRQGIWTTRQYSSAIERIAWAERGGNRRGDHPPNDGRTSHEIYQHAIHSRRDHVSLTASAYAQSPHEQLQQMVEQLQKTSSGNALRSSARSSSARRSIRRRRCRKRRRLLSSALLDVKTVHTAPWAAGCRSSALGRRSGRGTPLAQR